MQHVEMVRRTFQEEEMAQAEAQRLDWVDMLRSREKPEWLERWAGELEREISPLSA